MLITGGITLVLIGMEYKAAIREYSSDQLKYSHRAFPERPPEVYRELGRMKRMSTVLGSDGPFGPSMMTQGGGVNLLSHFRGKAPAAPSRLQLGAISRFDSPGGGPASPRREMNLSKLAVTSHHSWVDLTRVSAGKERGYTRRYGSVEAGVITLYCTYEDYILDVPSQSLALPLSSYKLAELSGDKEAALGMFELVPVVSHDGA
ncbi:hypothetical protein T492DRAFT_286397 [Pavlovales sp. CCMP2436]|nr:hypothetical protein T492DRAFT_286397 [Pavlovales sp. CCMP2436]